MAGEKIYAIEDEPPSRRLLLSALEGKGYDVTVFSSADAAMEHMGWTKDNPHFSKDLPDAIITGKTLRGSKTGFDILRLAKEADVPRMMTTGDMVGEHEVIAAGGKEAKLLYKPYSDKDMQDMVRGLVDAKVKTQTR